MKEGTRNRFLVIGSGGREHALVWKLAQDSEVFCTPGNPGICQIAKCFDVDSMDFDGIIELAKKLNSEGTELTVLVGPEAPLIEGIADRLNSVGISVFGPQKQAAQLEGSKAFSKDLMKKCGVRTARFKTFTDPDLATTYAETLCEGNKGVVIKASGNALGKGAIVCDNFDQAKDSIHDLMVAKIYGPAGSTIVVEERLSGFEFSLLTLVSGTEILSLPVAQDYKRAFDGDLGPNTGGMGSYSPVPEVSEALIIQSEKELVSPILEAMANLGAHYRGVLFTGVMVQDGLPYCIEYNVRFGDPETQSVMFRLGNGFSDALSACAKGAPIPSIEVLDNAAVTVVIAANGYPDKPEKGCEINLNATAKGKVGEYVLFHAGTKMVENRLKTSGGRVFGASASGTSVSEARSKAYDLVDNILFDGAWSRKDVALRS